MVTSPVGSRRHLHGGADVKNVVALKITNTCASEIESTVQVGCGHGPMAKPRDDGDPVYPTNVNALLAPSNVLYIRSRIMSDVIHRVPLCFMFEARLKVLDPRDGQHHHHCCNLVVSDPPVIIS